MCLQTSCSKGCHNPTPCWTRQNQARPNQPWAGAQYLYDCMLFKCSVNTTVSYKVALSLIFDARSVGLCIYISCWLQISFARKHAACCACCRTIQACSGCSIIPAPEASIRRKLALQSKYYVLRVQLYFHSEQCYLIQQVHCTPSKF